MKRLVAAFTVLFLIAGCEPTPTTLELPPPSDMILDGAHNSGNQHFFFLPPMVPNPSPSGTVDGSLSPEVEVCVWDGVICGATVAIFNENAGTGSETVRAEGEHYIVNWHTEDIIDNYMLEPGETLRVRVLAQGQELGFADIQVVGSGKQLKNVDTDEFIPLLDGRTLPIKFRIEEGALIQGEIASSGAFHACAVANDHQAYCWGRNASGELGLGFDSGNIPTPQPVTGGLSFVSVQAGRSHTCGLTTSGQIYCWGLNIFGQLGRGFVSQEEHTPAVVAGGHTFHSLTSLGNIGARTVCGVTTTGDMYCWGENGHGQVGNGTFSPSEPTPVLVTPGQTWAGPVAVERSVTCGLTTAGDIFCWGRNDFGQLGRGFAGASQPTPGAVVGGHTFESVTVGGATTCGIDAAGKALCWGHNGSGQLGIGTVSAPLLTPQFVTGGYTFDQLSAGRFEFNCGVTTDGEGLCWGNNNRGQLGRGFFGGNHPTPEPVVDGHTFERIGAGFQFTCGVTTARDVFCWGRNSSGQLGDGSFTQSHTPQFTLGLDP